MSNLKTTIAGVILVCTAIIAVGRVILGEGDATEAYAAVIAALSGLGLISAKDAAQP